eukprot:CAMPEP_0183830800 /NCGR_PEP_ID=MMETSP0807_2-20130328/4234_1 /TAXON_ID=88271 /ORGANISM="Picocystis salinarum, Strain CCMP1897" /LENGTH=336 /DNA_ID=CAMNT_0026076183 /DNA_START=52 /DNA_END=1063 /DNA_ORIENTATION=+
MQDVMAQRNTHVLRSNGAGGAKKHCVSTSTRLRSAVESGHPDAVRRRKQAEARRAEHQTDVSQTSGSTCWWENDKGTNVRDVGGLDELAQLVRGTTNKAGRNGQLVVVKYFAPWCNGCRTLFPKVLQLAERYPNVTFVKMNVGEDEDLAESLGVTKLPYFQFYNGKEGIVAHFTASLMPDKLRRLRAAVEYYQSPDACLAETTELPHALEEALQSMEELALVKLHRTPHCLLLVARTKRWWNNARKTSLPVSPCTLAFLYIFFCCMIGVAFSILDPIITSQGRRSTVEVAPGLLAQVSQRGTGRHPLARSIPCFLRSLAASSFVIAGIAAALAWQE